MSNNLNDFLKNKGLYNLKINGQVVLKQNNVAKLNGLDKTYKHLSPSPKQV